MSDLIAKLKSEDNIIQRLDYLEKLVQSMQTRTPRAEALDELSDNLGIIDSGEFRSGNGAEPGNGFCGVRMGYPAFTYNLADYNIVGVNEDILQFGLSALDGAAIFGSGKARLDSSGIDIISVNQAYKHYATVRDTGSGIANRTGTLGMHDVNDNLSFYMSAYGDETATLNSNPDFAAGSSADWSLIGSTTIEASDAPGTNGYCAYIPDGSGISIDEGGLGYVIVSSGGLLIRFTCKVEATSADLNITFWGSFMDYTTGSSVLYFEESNWHQEEVMIVVPAGTTVASISLQPYSGDVYLDSMYVISVNGANEISFEPSPVLRGNGVNYSLLDGSLRVVEIALNGDADLVIGDKAYVRIPDAMGIINGGGQWELYKVAAMCNTVSTSGIPTFTIKNNGVSILSTNLTIDEGSDDSKYAIVPAVIIPHGSDIPGGDPAWVFTGNQIEVACSVAGTGVQYAVVELTFRQI